MPLLDALAKLLPAAHGSRLYERGRDGRRTLLALAASGHVLLPRKGADGYLDVPDEVADYLVSDGARFGPTQYLLGEVTWPREQLLRFYDLLRGHRIAGELVHLIGHQHLAHADRLDMWDYLYVHHRSQLKRRLHEIDTTHLDDTLVTRIATLAPYHRLSSSIDLRRVATTTLVNRVASAHHHSVGVLAHLLDRDLTRRQRGTVARAIAAIREELPTNVDLPMLADRAAHPHRDPITLLAAHPGADVRRVGRRGLEELLTRLAQSPDDLEPNAAALVLFYGHDTDPDSARYADAVLACLHRLSPAVAVSLLRPEPFRRFGSAFPPEVSVTSARRTTVVDPRHAPWAVALFGRIVEAACRGHAVAAGVVLKTLTAALLEPGPDAHHWWSRLYDDLPRKHLPGTYGGDVLLGRAIEHVFIACGGDAAIEVARMLGEPGGEESLGQLVEGFLSAWGPST